MKREIRIVIDAEILRLAKKRAAQRRWTLNDLVQEALIKHLRKDAALSKERRAAYELFCERPMKVPRKQLRFILTEDMWRL
jgi:hypothetical protein